MIQHGEAPRPRPQHETGAAVGVLEGRAFILARRLIKTLRSGTFASGMIKDGTTSSASLIASSQRSPIRYVSPQV
jgi:hypothetical protein